MAEWYSIVKRYHIFFIHSSTDEHLGYFHVLAIVKSAIINIRVHVEALKKIPSSLVVIKLFFPKRMNQLRNT